MPEGTIKILTSGSHWKNPFEGSYQSIVDDSSRPVTLSTREKVKAIVIAIFIGLATAGIGGILSFYIATAYFKNRKIEQLLSNEIDVFANTLFKDVVNNIQGIPKNGIQVGLPNKTWTTCWLNVSLKFLSLSPVFDHIFTIDPAELTDDTDRQHKMKKLQACLFLAIQSLRRGDRDILSQTLYDRLSEAIRELTPDFHVGSRQEDAHDFLRFLLNDVFDFPGDNNLVLGADSPYTPFAVQVANRYAPHDNEKTKDPSVHFAQLILPLKILEEDFRSKDPLDLPTLLTAPSTVDDIEFTGTHEGENGVCDIETVLTHAPDTLTIMLDRSGRVDGKDIKCTREIAFDDDGMISFLLYDKEEDDDKRLVLTPISCVYYKPEFSIRHIGRGTDSGHYTCVEQPERGAPIMHNDTRCSAITEQRFMGECRQAYMLRLRKVKTETYLPTKTPGEPLPSETTVTSQTA